MGKIPPFQHSDRPCGCKLFVSDRMDMALHGTQYQLRRRIVYRNFATYSRRQLSRVPAWLLEPPHFLVHRRSRGFQSSLAAQRTTGDDWCVSRLLTSSLSFIYNALGL